MISSYWMTRYKFTIQQFLRMQDAFNPEDRVELIDGAKGQLIAQVLSGSLMIEVLAFAVSALLLVLLQNSFNELADKDIASPFDNLVYWSIAFVFIVLTGFMAGLYPAFYLSSFLPVKVLKGVLPISRFAALPRKVLVVIQFIAGRDFSRDFATDTTEVIIINQAAVEYMDLKNLIGQELTDVDEFGRPRWS